MNRWVFLGVAIIIRVGLWLQPDLDEIRESVAYAVIIILVTFFAAISLHWEFK
mgnify:CR=1 FL=1